MEKLIDWASQNGVTVGLIGGWQGVALKMEECLRKSYPQLDVFAIGDFAADTESEEAIIRTVDQLTHRKKPAMIFVALGAPKQEFFIEKLKSQIQKSTIKTAVILMAVGGAFDEYTGRVPRAPEWIHRIGFKWLWRLVVQPWRIRRQLALLQFIWLVVTEKLKMSRMV